MAEIINTGGVDTGAAPEGHDQAMLDAVANKEAELAQVGNDAPQDANQKILGKFNSQEELVKAYQELERKLGQQPRQQQQQPQDKASTLTDDKANELLANSGIDVEEMSEHFYENGSLSEEHYASLEQAGIPREYVDQYISGIQAEAEQFRDSLFEEVGGEEEFAAISEWALANLSQSELEEYNEAVESGDIRVVRSAVMSLAYRYQKAVGQEPSLVRGNNNGATGFESLAQLTAAMKDPRYRSDPAYRREVEQKLARSNIM